MLEQRLITQLCPEKEVDAVVVVFEVLLENSWAERMWDSVSVGWRGCDSPLDDLLNGFGASLITF